MPKMVINMEIDEHITVLTNALSSQWMTHISFAGMVHPAATSQSNVLSMNVAVNMIWNPL